MTLRNGDTLIEIDARPSDAIAIALRVGAPIFVNPALFDPPAPRPSFDEKGRRVRNRKLPPKVQIVGI